MRDGGAEDFGEFGFFFGGEFAEDEVDIGDFVVGRLTSVKIRADTRSVVGAKSEACEIFGIKMRDSGFEAIIATSGARLAQAHFAKIKVKIVAND